MIQPYEQGGQRVFCFNGIDTVSRYPTGQVYQHRRAVDAVDFLIHVMQTIGIAGYTQVDNEGCFSGGFTHPYVIGQFARLALQMGTELVFSPVGHPQSNGSVERFHQDYQQHVWQDTYLADDVAVQVQADQFFSRYRHSGHHSVLADQTPHQAHHTAKPQLLAATFTRPAERLPIYAGRLHFMRRVQPDGTVSVLNVNWPVPRFDPLKGVWVTVELQPDQSTLTIYDAAPGATDRQCLVSYPFPLTEAVLVRPDDLVPTSPPAKPAGPDDTHNPASKPNHLASARNHRRGPSRPLFPAIAKSRQRLLLIIRNASTRLARHIDDTIY